MITEKEWNDYTNSLREAYKIYHDALVRYRETHQNIGEEKIRLIGLLEDPRRASLGDMIAIGILGTRGDYENFYTIGIDGTPDRSGSENALQKLKELTYSNEDPEISRIIKIVDDTITLMEKIRVR
jgi:hypothetical protein